MNLIRNRLFFYFSLINQNDFILRPIIDTYGDHRIAMALAAVSCFVPGIIIKGAEAVSKSYPDFWADMQEAGFTIADADADAPDNAREDTTGEEAPHA